MITFTELEQVPDAFGPSAVTIGKFDGVHTGHRAVVAALLEEAAAAGLSSVAVTFDRNPLSLINPDRCPASLVSNEQKLGLLADAGVDAALLLRFDQTLAQLTPGRYLATPGLWIGLAFAVAFVAESCFERCQRHRRPVDFN